MSHWCFISFIVYFAEINNFSFGCGMSFVRQAYACGHKFGAACLERAVEADIGRASGGAAEAPRLCPLDRRPIHSDGVHRHMDTVRAIWELTVKCHVAPGHCPATGKLGKEEQVCVWR